MKINNRFRKGMGLSQIMATLLVVVPTLAFIVTLLLDYWAVMQADYRLKLVANLTSDFADAREDLRNFSGSDYTSYLTSVNKLCPGSTTIEFTSLDDNAKGEVAITVDYVYNGTYFKNKTITSKMYTYSFFDKNVSAVATCN